MDRKDQDYDALQIAINLLSRVGDGFIITTVNREDILQSIENEDIKMKASDVKKIDDADMIEIAEKMADAYCDNCFWIDLPIIVESVIKK